MQLLKACSGMGGISSRRRLLGHVKQSKVQRKVLEFAAAPGVVQHLVGECGE